jgi:1-acyl-sn-glycerol-3-phosphate acyltransferase
VLYSLGEFLVALWFFLFTRRIVTGKTNVPRCGPLLVVANHLNNADPPLIGICLGRKARFMAKEELFANPVAGFLLQSVGAFPVNRKRPGRNSLQDADQALVEGYPLVMFPESTRSRTGKMKTGLPGAAAVAIKNGVPVLPIGITGTEKLKGVFWWLTRPTIKVNIGKPFKLTSEAEKPTKEELSTLTGTIMKNIALLIPSEYRGEYA